MEMSKKLKIPVSTLFDTLKEVEKTFKFTIVLKDKERKVYPGNNTPFGCEYKVQ